MMVYVQDIYSQNAHPGIPVPNTLLFNTIEFIRTDSGLIINRFSKDACKNYTVKTEFIPEKTAGTLKPLALTYTAPLRPKFIVIHGNVSYDFYYRSKIDTPFNQQDLQQHTERVWLDVMIREKYPFKVGFTARQSNSPFYKDLYTMNLNFDRYGYTRNIKQNMLNRLSKVQWQNPDLKVLDAALKEQLKRYQLLKNYVNGPEALQRMIEEKERGFYSKQKKEIVLPSTPSASIPSLEKMKLNSNRFPNIKTDSLLHAKMDAQLPVIDSSFAQNLQKKKNELDSLEKSIARLKRQSDSIKGRINENMVSVKKAIYKASTPQDLEKIAKENGIAEPSKEKMQKFISNIKTLGIGRSLVDYSELTAQNVMLTGINLEYNPSYYAAFAAGKIDYGFRDFFGRGIKQKNQYLVLGRLGWGNKEKRSVILTIFNGRKNNFSGLLAAGSSNTSKLFGYSIETIFRKDENTFVSLEVAKSTKTSPAPASLIAKSDNLFNYSDQSNMGYNIKAQTQIPETDTRLSGFFRKTGEEFQSFSLFTYFTNQQAWQLKAEQSFLRRKINLTAMLRQNDFTSPLTDKTFKTSTVFKSIQLNVKVPHWPILNAGYYPGSQYYIVDNKTIRENAYYILNGSVLYPYRFKDIAMNSSFIFNRFYNQATDSGFILYKGVNYILSQSVLLNKLQMQGSYSYNKQAEINYYTLDANGDYNLNKTFRVGGGIKFNHVQSGTNYWGKSVRLGADLKKLGSLQLHYEKSYLPTIQQTLSPVEIGRVSWYKIF